MQPKSLRAFVLKNWGETSIAHPTVRVEEEGKLLTLVNLLKGKGQSLQGGNLIVDFDFSAFNFNKIPQEQVLFILDFQTQQCYSVADKPAIDEMDDPPEIHYLVANAYPVCRLHCLLVPFPEEHLPQVMGADVLSQSIGVFDMEHDPHLRLGFNSLGAAASVNHLHLHALYIDQISKQCSALPVELSTLQLKKVKKFMNYESEVSVFVTTDYPLPAIVLKAQDKEDGKSALSFAFGFFVNVLIARNVPHNFMISEKGLTLYLFPRRFQKDCSLNHYSVGWLEASGVGVLREESKSGSLEAQLTHLRLPFFAQLWEDGIAELK